MCLYFGLLLGAPYKAKYIWDGVIEKIERQLASWKMLYLSKGGRISLIKSTISNLPTYFMALFPPPLSIANHIEKLQRDFLWGGLGEKFKCHLVSWPKMCTLISEGRLGIRNMLRFNHALLGKWLWCYGLEREALWRVVVNSKYESSWGWWCSSEPVGGI